MPPKKKASSETMVLCAEELRRRGSSGLSVESLKDSSTAQKQKHRKSMTVKSENSRPDDGTGTRPQDSRRNQSTRIGRTLSRLSSSDRSRSPSPPLVRPHSNKCLRHSNEY
eukprot:CAMPEP_0185858118 /NCGR_PEP_ID=MMETSP1354-20130828/29853_1 /TAXON_ID=708628 /ORGANISM="Erythrolobus madagascarensis, Strain CCMP3276" /LENGTH=110 /DNA_ID=CAMNT_0028560399 /DNA_START=44 /DNA_END=376 /DNA_ORIENTATION=+